MLDFETAFHCVAKNCSTSSRKEWSVRQNDHATAKGALFKQRYSSKGCGNVWTIGLNDYTKAKSEILKLMYCSKPSSRVINLPLSAVNFVKHPPMLPGFRLSPGLSVVGVTVSNHACNRVTGACSVLVCEVSGQEISEHVEEARVHLETP